MAAAVIEVDRQAEQRAALSGGRSADAITAMVGRAVACRCATGLVVVDVGCGRGDLFAVIGPRTRRYIGVDALRYPGLPPEVEFVAADLNGEVIGIAGGIADVVAAVETIEHLENPRAFVRLLAQLLKPGGWLFVTTPNQRSLLSLASLMVKGEFAHFQGVHYPAHLTALLEVDLRRIAGESGLDDIRIEYSGSGRIPGTAAHYPDALARAFPRALSDNLMLVARRPTR
jgi:2-polyprenyl-3-methyl-5-hydroxy-6-metoxy-1,4-benzoquinol methylase